MKLTFFSHKQSKRKTKTKTFLSKSPVMNEWLFWEMGNLPDTCLLILNFVILCVVYSITIITFFIFSKMIKSLSFCFVVFFVLRFKFLFSLWTHILISISDTTTKIMQYSIFFLFWFKFLTDFTMSVCVCVGCMFFFNIWSMYKQQGMNKKKNRLTKIRSIQYTIV